MLEQLRHEGHYFPSTVYSAKNDQMLSEMKVRKSCAKAAAAFSLV